jgi:hypothetical protein
VAVGLTACLPDPGARLDSAALHLTVLGLRADVTDVRAELSGASDFEDPGLTRSPQVEAQTQLELFWVTLPSALYTVRLSAYGLDGGQIQCATFVDAVAYRGRPLNVTVDLEAGASCASAPSMDADVTQDSDVPPPDRGQGVARDAAGTPPDARGNAMTSRPEKDARVRPDR